MQVIDGLSAIKPQICSTPSKVNYSVVNTIQNYIISTENNFFAPICIL